MSSATGGAPLDPGTLAFYRRSVEALTQSGTPFLVGGAYAFGRYTGIERHTKDFDVFVRRGDLRPALATLEGLGLQTEVTFPHWLAKVFHAGDYVDVIFSSGNGITPVDDAWFARAPKGEVLGLPVSLVPAEEMIWSKAFIMERERFDGADIMHLIRARGEQLDWDHLLARFRPHPRVLLSHLLLFGFVYPDRRALVPEPVLKTLMDRALGEDTDAVRANWCGGTLLSRTQYLVDVTDRGYRDPRLDPPGTMTAADVAHWTAAALGEP